MLNPEKGKKQMAYFDFMVVPVPKTKLAAYRACFLAGSSNWVVSKHESLHPSVI
jgi:hypothetical protein